MDIYRICSLGKTLTETINEVITDPTNDLVEKIWSLYDQAIEEEMKKLREHDATISGSLETFQRIPLENSNNNKQVCRLVIKDVKINYKQNNQNSSIPLPPGFLKIVAYEQPDRNTAPKKGKPQNKSDH